MSVSGAVAGRVYPVGPIRRTALSVREPDSAGAPKPRLLDRVREAVRIRHYSRRTEKASLVRHTPATLGHQDVSTTMIYTHVLNRGPAGLRSPVDRMFL